MRAPKDIAVCLAPHLTSASTPGTSIQRQHPAYSFETSRRMSRLAQKVSDFLPQHPTGHERLEYPLILPCLLKLVESNDFAANDVLGLLL